MEEIRKIVSRTVVMPTRDIDTDQIIPARFLTTTSREGLGEYAFNDLRRNSAGEPNPDFILNQPAAKGCHILVAGNNFGCGSSREHAPWALLDFGFQAVVSTEIADIFKTNALKNGLIPVVVDKKTHRILLDQAGIELCIDIEALTLSFGDNSTIAFQIDSFARYCLLNGVDQLGYIRQQSAAIDAFEEQRSWTP